MPGWRARDIATFDGCLSATVIAVHPTPVVITVLISRVGRKRSTSRLPGEDNRRCSPNVQTPGQFPGGQSATDPAPLAIRTIRYCQLLDRRFGLLLHHGISCLVGSLASFRELWR